MTKKQSLLTILLNTGKISSVGEGRLLLAEKAIKVNGNIVVKDIEIEMCDEVYSEGRFRFLVSNTDIT